MFHIFIYNNYKYILQSYNKQKIAFVALGYYFSELTVGNSPQRNWAAAKDDDQNSNPDHLYPWQPRRTS